MSFCRCSLSIPNGEGHTYILGLIDTAGTSNDEGRFHSTDPARAKLNVGAACDSLH
jgi:hypothetical protein